MQRSQSISFGFHTDSFNDEELTIMAEEITQHFNKGANPYETDSGPYIPSTENSTDQKSSSISYFSPITDDNTVNHPSLSPKIISESGLSSNDSFNISVPSIPWSKPSPKHKQAVNGWCRTKTISYSTHHNLPYIPPPSKYHGHDPGQLPFISDIASCISPPDISPRKTVIKQAVSQIPNFCPLSDDTHEKHEKEKSVILPNINTTNKSKHNKKKKRKHHKCKCHKHKNTLQCVMSPIIIDLEKHNYMDTKHKGFLIQPIIRSNERVNKKRNKHNRMCSVQLNMNDYMAENGFMIVGNDSV